MTVQTDIIAELITKTENILQSIDKTLKTDIWGGVGVACLEWSLLQPNLLAAVTFKTQTLEVWDTQTCNFINRIKFDQKICKVSWSPSEKNTLLLLTTNGFVFKVDYLTGQSKKLDLGFVTSASWHPRQAGRVLVGKLDGKVQLIDTKSTKTLMEYNTPALEESKAKENQNQAKITDICFSPGEDVFLVLRADGNLYLFGQEEPQIRMEFEQQNAQISKV